ncbi:glycerophosphodiester phosphodiesterase family protein [Cnuibacter sp. UC19_7]|uniref:glycerophosphodiester phosphodiesterase family protein n=1 Tax=Cnuibacter sp. UC19_7 TaxID=3350166 RepID=UPI00366A92CE
MSAAVIAHRGASGHRPEHSLAAYLLASEQGADAVEPDVVLSKDGVPVIRHENEISGTTDIAQRPEFAARRRTRSVDGQLLTGWFTEDLTWEELSTLRAREPHPGLRPLSAAHDGEGAILRLRDVLAVCDRRRADGSRPGVVVEIKHAAHFAERGLDAVAAVADELAAAGWSDADDRLVIESFEPTALRRVAARMPPARRVLLLERTGVPWDLARQSAIGRGPAPLDSAAMLTDAGLDRLASEVAGISVDKAVLVGEGADGAGLVARAHDRGLLVYTWTLRPENVYLEDRHRRGPADGRGDWETEFAAVLATGVDGVFADHPDLALAVRRSALV